MNYWVCKTRLKLLTDFREVFGQYAAVVEAEDKSGNRASLASPVLYKLRNQASRDVHAVQEALDDVAAGRVERAFGPHGGDMIPVVLNAFNPWFDPPPWRVIEHVERGIGIYERRQRRALLEMLSPFTWIHWLIALLVREIVFRPLGALLGKDVGDIARTPGGRATLAILQAFGNVASIISVVLVILFRFGVL